MKMMKNIVPVMMVLIIVALTIYLSSCKKNTPSVTEVNTRILTSPTWKIKKLLVDNADQTSLYTNMTLTFTNTTYTATNGEPVWPASGTWSLSDDGLKITRDDDLIITVSSISDTELTLELDWTTTTYSGGRKSSVQGHHVFTFME